MYRTDGVGSGHRSRGDEYAGIGVLSGNLFGRIVGVALAGLSAIVNMLFAEAAPVWAVIIIIVDVFVIYALIVHGREMEA